MELGGLLAKGLQVGGLHAGGLHAGGLHRGQGRAAAGEDGWMPHQDLCLTQLLGLQVSRQ